MKLKTPTSPNPTPQQNTAQQTPQHLTIQQGQMPSLEVETPSLRQQSQFLQGPGPSLIQQQSPTSSTTNKPPALSPFDGAWPAQTSEGTYIAYADTEGPQGWTGLDIYQWQPEKVIEQGNLTRTPEGFSAKGMPAMDPYQADMIKQATVDLWEHTLKYRFADGGIGEHGTVMLGDGGSFELGHFTNPLDGQSYDVLRWDDLDDNSFTLFYQPGADGTPTLKASQYDN